MEWIFCYLILIQCLSTTADPDLIINRLKDIIQRRQLQGRGPLIIGVPRDPEDLPEAEPILPGHTLLRPARGMLKSSVKFPRTDFGNLVYGNMDNVGIRYGNEDYRTMYTGFRKTNNLLATLRDAIREEKRKPSIVVIEIDTKSSRGISSESYLENPNQETEEENNASEMLDIDDVEQSREDYRRKRSRSKSNYRDREKMYSSTESEEESSGSSDYEKNPGNPYTVHKNKYIQNWMWNHVMDGDHMNINPFAPKLKSNGPSGAEIFFGRKWWYFNQDDYKPMG